MMKVNVRLVGSLVLSPMILHLQQHLSNCIILHLSNFILVPACQIDRSALGVSAVL